MYAHFRRRVSPGTVGLVLPSANSADEFVQGKPGAGARVLSHFLGRAFLVAPGLYIAGARNPETLIKYSLAASATIEAFVLGFAYYNKDKPKT